MLKLSVFYPDSLDYCHQYDSREDAKQILQCLYNKEGIANKSEEQIDTMINMSEPRRYTDEDEAKAMIALCKGSYDTKRGYTAYKEYKTLLENNENEIPNVLTANRDNEGDVKNYGAFMAQTWNCVWVRGIYDRIFFVWTGQKYEFIGR